MTLFLLSKVTKKEANKVPIVGELACCRQKMGLFRIDYPNKRLFFHLLS